jgi:hypothetical protein
MGLKLPSFRPSLPLEPKHGYNAPIPQIDRDNNWDALKTDIEPSSHQCYYSAASTPLFARNPRAA